jgi:hypothetical protein
VKIMNVHPLAYGRKTKLVGFADGLSRLHPPTGHTQGKRINVMIASCPSGIPDLEVYALLGVSRRSSSRHPQSVPYPRQAV